MSTQQHDAQVPIALRVPKKVTAGQVQIARWRLARDSAAGRPTPEPYRRIAAVRLPEDSGS